MHISYIKKCTKHFCWGGSMPGSKPCRTQQRGFILNLCENIMKHCTPERFILIGKYFSQHCSLIMHSAQFDSCDADSDTIMSIGDSSTGYFVQSFIDMHILRLCAEALDYSALGEQSKCPMPHRLRLECVAADANSAKISVRFRALFKQVNGATKQIGKHAWEVISKASSNHSISLEVASPQSVKDLAHVISVFSDGTSSQASDWMSLTDDLAELCDEWGDKLTKLAQCFGVSFQPSSVEQHEIAALLKATPKALISHLSTILKTMPLARFTQDLFCKSLLSSEWYGSFKKSVVDGGAEVSEDCY